MSARQFLNKVLSPLYNSYIIGCERTL